MVLSVCMFRPQLSVTEQNKLLLLIGAFVEMGLMSIKEIVLLVLSLQFGMAHTAIFLSKTVMQSPMLQ